jgi:predicted LPLAT superfamily acyltransferase
VQRYADSLARHARDAPFNWFNFYDFWDDANDTAEA